jgi:predicted dehydrogenase
MRGARSEGNEPISSRYLVVSHGSIGRRHVANIRKLCPEAKIGVLRSGVSRDNVLSLKADGVDRQFWSAMEAIAFQPDAVVIASPASTHLEFGQIFASHGIPILIEKPLSHKLIGLSDFTSLIADGDMYAKVAYNLRFKPSLQYVRREILSGAIGDVLSVRVEVGQFLPDWRPEIDYRESVSSRAQMGGGALLELSHEIDYVLWIFGTPIETCNNIYV